MPHPDDDYRRTYSPYGMYNQNITTSPLAAPTLVGPDQAQQAQVGALDRMQAGGFLGTDDPYTTRQRGTADTELGRTAAQRVPTPGGRLIGEFRRDAPVVQRGQAQADVGPPRRQAQRVQSARVARQPRQAQRVQGARVQQQRPTRPAAVQQQGQQQGTAAVQARPRARRAQRRQEVTRQQGTY